MSHNYDEQTIDAMVRPLFEAMAQRVTAEEMQTLRQAYSLAKQAHKPQYRKGGDPYIVHPIAVARIVGEEMMLGTNAVCAAFLHDVVEDTPYTLQQIEELFGKDIAFLVDVVTKSPNDQYKESKQIDNYRQLINSINYDIRALLIKLADRLHNMRTLSSMRPDKQMKIAGETDYFYAPLANRLGLYDVKVELENLSFRYRCPREYAQLEQLIAADKAKNEPMLTAFLQKIQQQLQYHGIYTQVEIVYRRPFSIRRKMQRSEKDFQHVSNRCFIRVVYDDCQGMSEKVMALRIYALLTDICQEKPGSFINYIDTPKDNGYQSLHVRLLADHGQWMELHICSTRMQLFSQLGCVAEREEGYISQWIERFKNTLQDITYHSGDINLMDGVQASFYNDNIVVYTPHGKAVTLPKNATALDFAFEIHSNVGLHAVYARINGKLCSVKTELQRGDCVEIGTREEAQPDESWMQYVQTFRAKRQLRSWWNHRPVPALLRCNHCLPIPGDEVIGFRQENGKIEVHKRDCPLIISLASQHGDSVEAVDFLPEEHILYPVSIHIRAIDRRHLMFELLDSITNQLFLPIEQLHTQGADAVVECDINFRVHSYYELETVINTLHSIRSVEEVWQQEYEKDSGK